MSYWRSGVFTLALGALALAAPLAGAAIGVDSDVVSGTYDPVAAEIAQAELSSQLIELEGVLPEAVVAKPPPSSCRSSPTPPTTRAACSSAPTSSSV